MLIMRRSLLGRLYMSVHFDLESLCSGMRICHARRSRRQDFARFEMNRRIDTQTYWVTLRNVNA